MLSSDFLCKENYDWRLVSGSYPYTQDSSHVLMVIMKSRSLFVESSMSCQTGDESWVYGYDPETAIFPYKENPTRALNIISLKCCLPSTEAIDRRQKLTHACEDSRLLHASSPH